MFGETVLFSEMSPPPALEAEFNDWYDQEHIPIRMRAPGFRSAQRYLAGERDYLAVYDMDGPAALDTPEYRSIKSQPSEVTRRMLASVSGFTRYIGRQISIVGDPAAMLTAPLLYAVFFNVPAERQADFDAWYDEDHVPLLMEAPQWLGVRRFDIIDGEPGRFTRLALHYLGDRAVLDGPERERARNTPWRARLALEDWFKGSYKVFSQHGARQPGQGGG